MALTWQIKSLAQSLSFFGRAASNFVLWLEKAIKEGSNC